MEYDSSLQMVLASAHELVAHGLTPAEIQAGAARGGFVKTAPDASGQLTNYFVSTPTKSVTLPDQFGDRGH